MARLMVKCTDNRSFLQEKSDGTYQVAIGERKLISLTIGQVYEVLESDDDFYRIVDNTGEDYWYPMTLFEPED